MNTSSPLANGGVLKVFPIPGVDIVHVKIPVFDDSTFSIATPLLLFVVKTSTVSSGKPFGSVSISTEEIADPVIFTSINPESITLLSLEFTRVTNGGDT